MKSTFLLILTALAAGAAGYYIYEYLTRRKKRVLTEDPKAQKEYASIKQKKEEIKEEHLSLEEKIAKSWEFLTNITNQVLEKFSKNDQVVVKDASNKMVKHGMVYHHDIELEIKQGTSRAQSVTKKRATAKTASR